MRLSSRTWKLWISTTTATAAASSFVGGPLSSSSSSFALAWTTKPRYYRTVAAASTVAGRYSFVSSTTSLSRYNHHHKSSHIITTTTTAMASLSSSSSSSTAPTSVRVGLLQLEVSSNKDVNHQRVTEFVTRAAQQGVQLVVLPEIWNGPYATAAFGEYAEVLPHVGDTIDTEHASPSARLLQTLAVKHQLWLVGGSISEKVVDTDSGTTKLYNTCLVMNPQGTIVAKHRKVHLFDINVPGGICFQESATLSPGQTLSWFDSPFGRIGVGICYDIRFPEYALALARMTAATATTTTSDDDDDATADWQRRLTMLIYPGAFNLTTGPAHWELLQRARALDNQCYCLTASPARVTAEVAATTASPYPHYTAWGHSTLVGPWGDVIATCEEGPALVVADIDLTKVPQIRQQIPILQQKRYDLYTPVDAADKK